MKNLWLDQKIKRLNRKLKNQSKYNDNKYLWIGFFIFGFILLINILIMLCFLMNSEYQYRVINHAYIDAVLPNQEINTTLQLGIVKIKEVKLEDLQVGDSVVIYGDFNLDIYWVETIISINSATKEVELTYNNANTSIYHEDDIVGTYVKDANFIGTIYYSASFTKGFILLTISHVFLLSGYYYIFIIKKAEVE